MRHQWKVFWSAERASALQSGGLLTEEPACRIFGYCMGIRLAATCHGSGTMKRHIYFHVFSCLLLAATSASAQHCAPIVESYLSQISIGHNKKYTALELEVEYAKLGGRYHPKYQIYLLAYLTKNEDRVPAPLPADFIDTKVVYVLHTEAIKQAKDGNYDFRVRFDMTELAQKIIELGHLTDADRADPGGWGSYTDSFRLAIFIPFLDDSTYSVLDSLPQDRHECHHRGQRELLFQQLPYSFTIHYGMVLAARPPRLPEGQYRVQINQDKPIKANDRVEPGVFGQRTKLLEAHKPLAALPPSQELVRRPF
jgi:hypothetical protein